MCIGFDMLVLGLTKAYKVVMGNHGVVNGAWLWMVEFGYCTLYITARDWVCASETVHVFLKRPHEGGKGNQISIENFYLFLMNVKHAIIMAL